MLMVVSLTLGTTHAFVPTYSGRHALVNWRTSAVNLPESVSAAEADWDLELFSPAKINLFLRVMSRRPDGFHELASLFQTIGLGDDLSFAKLSSDSHGDEFTCNMPGMPLDSSNLVLRALELFRERTGSAQFFRCRLSKRTPMQAGLGGGSSNAATALYAANQLCGSPASDAQLIEWSGELGSDITFFLGDSGTAYCTGRGEIIEPVKSLPSTELFVIKPADGLSTPLVFKTLAASNYATCSTVDPKELLLSFASSTSQSVNEYVNDLEAPAFELMDDLATIKTGLLAEYGFPVAMMSGSGTSLFAMGEPAICTAGEFPARFTADMAKRDIDVQVWRTRFVDRAGPGSWYAAPE
jgi:4-diphosphocytidyl-2-C-methyl-D-erythritol kinase